MRKYPMCAVLGALILLASFSIALAQMSEHSGSRDPLKTAPADLSGLWLVHPSDSASAYSSFAFGKEIPPMTDWGKEKYKAAKPAFGPNKTMAAQSNDPVYGCFPPGLPRIYLHPKPIEIV